MRSFQGLPLASASLALLVSCTNSITGLGGDGGGDAGLNDGGEDGGNSSGVNGGDGGPSGCPASACKPGGTCTVEDDDYVCTCAEGFAGTGPQTCTDVDECLSAPCGQGDCTNLAGSYACDCSDGYRFDGSTCVDIDECAQSTNACGDGAATCTNQPGGFLCDGCPAGSRPADGPFSACVDIDECAGNPSICGNGGTCANATPGYTCSACNVGFASDGASYPKCVDVNECALGTDTCADAEPCTNTAGSFVCACLENMRTVGTNCIPVLSALEVSAGTLTPAFEGEITSYTVTLPPGVARYDLTPRVGAPGNQSIEVDGQTVASGESVTIDVPSLVSQATTIELTVAGETTAYQVQAARTIAYLEQEPRAQQALLGAAIAVSADGNTLVVGAPQEHLSDPSASPSTVGGRAGAAYVYTRDAAGWTQQTRLRPLHLDGGTGGSALGDLFGYSVAISADGNTIAVGALGEDSKSTTDSSDNSGSSTGAVFVYTRSGSSWTEQAYIKAPPHDNDAFGGDDGDQFGFSVAISADGNTLLIGAPLEASSANTLNGDRTNNASPFTGAAYTFTRSDTDSSTWAFDTYFKAPNAGNLDQFGTSVALDSTGTTALIGAPGEDSSATGIGGADDDLSTNAGAAFVFAKSQAGWALEAYLKTVSAAPGARLGTSVALTPDGNTAAVGAPLFDQERGAVEVYARSAGVWSPQKTLAASNPGATTGAGESAIGDRFGFSMALAGNTLLVSSPFEDGSGQGVDPADNNDTLNAGAAYVFARTGAIWATPTYLKASNTRSSDTLPGEQFGSAVAVSADESTLVVGAQNQDGTDGDLFRSGAVYVY